VEEDRSGTSDIAACPVIKRMPLLYVKYAQNQLIMVKSRFRSPTKKLTCTTPQSHQASAPHSLTVPKSTTAAFRPIVARLACLAAGASPGTGWPFKPMLTAVSPIAKTSGKSFALKSGPTRMRRRCHHPPLTTSPRPMQRRPPPIIRSSRRSDVHRPTPLPYRWRRRGSRVRPQSPISRVIAEQLSIPAKMTVHSG